MLLVKNCFKRSCPRKLFAILLFLFYFGKLSLKAGGASFKLKILASLDIVDNRVLITIPLL